jgi:hypothetical protein
MARKGTQDLSLAAFEDNFGQRPDPVEENTAGLPGHS